MGYKHISNDERETILKMRENCKTMEEIAVKLCRNRSTISRELRRNVSSTGEYKAYLAQKYYENRRKDSKKPYKLEDVTLRNYVNNKLGQGWSPEQISGRLEADGSDMNLCPGTIYSHVRDDKANGGLLYQKLRHGSKKKKKKYGSSDNRGFPLCCAWTRSRLSHRATAGFPGPGSRRLR